MIEIIRKAPKQRVECGRCKSLLAYAHDDVQINQNQYDYYTFIVCPECGNRIEVDRSSQVPFWERER